MNSKLYFQWYYKWQIQIALCLDFFWSHVLHKLDGHTVSNMFPEFLWMKSQVPGSSGKQ